MQIGAARDRARGAAAQRDLVELPVLRVGAAEDHQNAARLVEMLEAGVAEVERRERPQDGPVGLAQLELPLAARLGAPEESGAARQPTGIPPRLDPGVVVLAQEVACPAALRVGRDERQVLLIA